MALNSFFFFVRPRLLVHENEWNIHLSGCIKHHKDESQVAQILEASQSIIPNSGVLRRNFLSFESVSIIHNESQIEEFKRHRRPREAGGHGDFNWGG